MSTLPTDKLSKLIDAKHQCLVQLLDLGEQQAKLIDCGDMGQILKLLALKQHVIASLQSVETHLVPFRNEEPKERVWRDPFDRNRCAAVAEACRQLLNEIVQQEKLNESRMKKRRDATAAELQHAHTANRAREAYSAQSTLPSPGHKSNGVPRNPVPGEKPDD
ncbi:MAG: flagellar export chaperone FlgN [Pirellulales bacterium]|nr:flagellar export chaperone FlgN [Pirellulales bacterium]